MIRFFKLLFFILLVNCVQAQDFSNKGKDFWVCFPQHVPSGTQLATLSLFITSDQASSGVVTMPNNAFTANFNIAANGLQEIVIPWNAAIHIANSESTTETVTNISKKAINIKVNPNQPAVVAYAQQWAGARSAATLLLPVNVLGKKYYTVSFTQNGSNNGTYIAKSQFQVIATRDNTVIEITPRKNGVVQTKFTVTLPLAGDMIQYQSSDPNSSTQDLTGTLIESIPSGTGECLPIAVFSGTSNVTFGQSTPNCNGGSFDPLWQQLYATGTWGKNFGFVPFSDYPNGVPYRVMASEDNTVVSFNGAVVATLNAGQIYPSAFTSNPLTLTVPTSITADKPISVTQYAQTQGCSGNSINVGDPDMVILNPLEQNISDITIFSSSRQSISRNWINVLMKTSAIPSFRINGIAPATAWQPFPSLPGYSYLRHLLGATGSFRLLSDSGFNAIAYGFGNFESYAYSAGTNVRDLSQQISTATQFGIELTPNVCTGTPFKFKLSLPYQPDSLLLDFQGALNPPGAPFVNTTMTSPIVDSTTIVNGRTIYWYSFPSFYTFNNVGVYPIRIRAFAPAQPGSCGTVQDIDFELTVSNPPVVDFTNSAPRCVAETVQFTDATTSAKPTYRWYWDFGDPGSGAANNTSSLKNPTHLFSAPGTYNVRFSAITTVGCIGDTITRQIIIAPLPSGTISGTANVCVNGTQPVITFTGTGGSAPYTFTYNINGGAAQTITTTGVLTTATVTAPTATAGPFVYNLVNVQNTGSTLCTAAITGQSATIRVNPLPTATISGNTTVCQNSASPAITFTGANATAPYTFTYNINGGATQTVTTTVGNSVTVAAPTGTFGTFVYNLVSVSESSTTTCSNAVTGQAATVNVSPLPMVTITGTTAVCRNAAAPLVTFTGSNGTAPYTFTYNINGGANQTITTTASNNSVTLNASTATAGPYIYTVTSVTDGSAQACANTGLSQSVTITVNPLPTAAISTNITSVCVNAISPVITLTGAAGTAPYTFNYNINSVPQTAIISTGNIATINVPTTGAGTFIYQLTSVTDASSTLCAQPQNGQVTVIVQALPTATMGTSTAVCQNAPNPLITFTGAGGTRPYTFTYNINGGATQTIATTAASNSVTVAAPTTGTGTFTYSLLSVSETSANNCGQVFASPSTAVITVNPLPTATVTGGTNVCLNAASPTVTFTGAAGTAPYTFTYTINGAAQTALVSTGNIASLSVPTNAAGTFIYQLVSVQDASSTTCSQLQNSSTSFTIYPAPVAVFTNSTPLCDELAVSFNSSTSTAGAGTITLYAWDFGDPASGANTSAAANPTHIFSGTGIFTVTLTITTSNSCVSSVATSNITINPKPNAGFVLPEVCLLDPFAQFTDTSSVAAPSTITGWLWNFGDPGSGAANTSNAQNATHTYSAVGNYNVQLIAITNSGCRDTLVQVLTVNGGNPMSNFAQQSPGMNCANDSVGIINQSTIASGTITKIEIYWDNTGMPTVFDTDDFPTPGKIYRHKYPDFQSPLTRTFNVRMRAYSGGVCFSDRIVAITVNASPRVQFNAIPNTCYVTAPFQITQASEIGGVPGTAVFSGPGVSATGIFNPTGQAIGVPLTIKYVFTASAGGCKDSASQTITILDTAQARFTIITPSCERSLVTFTDQSVASAGTTISNTTWNFGDGSAVQTFAAGAPITHTYAVFGAYTVTMYVTNSEGCRSTSTTRIVNVAPIPRPSFTFDKTDYCLPNALVTFNSSSSTIADGTQASFTYAWDFGDPSSGSLNTSTSVNPTHIYRAAGSYPVRLTITSGAGCSKDTVIILDRLHPQPFADFSIAKKDLCVDQSAVLTDLSTGADGVLTNWNWSFGEAGATSNLQNPPAYVYSGPGTYNVKLTVTNNFGCIKDTTKVINVYNYPLVDAGEDRFVLEGGSVTLMPTVTAVLPQYNWTWNVPAANGYLNNNLIRNPVSTPLTDVTYRLTVTGAGECASSDTVFIKLLLAPRIPNTFSPNNDGINDTWVIKYLETYPKAKVKVFTRTGELVFQVVGYIRPWNGTKNGKALPIDTYYYVIEPENGRAPITGYVTILK